MIGVLQDILCMVAAVGAFVLWALVSAVNLLLVSLGLLIGGIVALMPSMPAEPDPIGGDVLEVVNYFFPLGGVVAALVALVALWGAFLLIRIPLRWAKVL
jgi:hypothetical protein